MDEQREHTSGIQEAGVGGPRSAHSPGGVQRAQVPVRMLQSLQSERGVIGSKGEIGTDQWACRHVLPGLPVPRVGPPGSRQWPGGLHRVLPRPQGWGSQGSRPTE